jgi:hypothetical protein
LAFGFLSSHSRARIFYAGILRAPRVKGGFLESTDHVKSVPWIGQNLNKVCLFVGKVDLQKVLEAPEGHWSSVEAELIRVCDTKIGHELFFPELEKVVIEKLQALIARRLNDDIAKQHLVALVEKSLNLAFMCTACCRVCFCTYHSGHRVIEKHVSIVTADIFQQCSMRRCFSN